MTSPVGPTVVMFGDSLSFHGPDRPYPSDEPRLWPNIAADALDGHMELFAGVGWTARDAYWSLTGDPRVWAQLPKADVIVLAVGGMDTLPSPLPTYLRLGIRYLRPARVRRAVRKGYLAAQPALSRLTMGRVIALPVSQTVRYLDETVVAIRTLLPDIPVIAILPSVHRSRAYGLVHTARKPAELAIRRWAARAEVSLLDLKSIVAGHVLSGAGNPDGIHWGWEGHELVGAALAELIKTVRKTE